MKPALYATGTFAFFILCGYGMTLLFRWMDKHLSLTQSTLVTVSPALILIWCFLYKLFKIEFGGDTKPGE